MNQIVSNVPVKIFEQTSILTLLYNSEVRNTVYISLS